MYVYIYIFLKKWFAVQNTFYFGDLILGNISS